MNFLLEKGGAAYNFTNTKEGVVCHFSRYK